MRLLVPRTSVHRSASLRTIALTCAAAVTFASCAVPVAPTGGPADARPPEILTTAPAEGTTSYSGTRLKITFSEYVNEASFARAFSISPELDQPVEISWRRRTVTIQIRSPLRENTTYRVTVDKSLRDANGVTLLQPIVFAFSTGPEINKARLVGIVRRGATGDGAGDMDIFAYAASADSLETSTLPARPLYRTQTNTRGEFELTYLAAGDYFIVGVSDRNANRVADDGEWVGIPDHPAATASVASPDSLILTAFLLDETPPEIRRTRALSSTRVEVRYSEPVVLGGSPGLSALSALSAPPTTGWILSDSSGTRRLDVERVYISAADPSTVVLETAAHELASTARTLRLITDAVSDSAANAALIDTVYFAASPAVDTTAARLLDVTPTGQPSDSVATLTASEWPLVALSAPRSPVDWLQVRWRSDDGSLRGLPFESRTRDGRSYIIVPELTDPTKPFALIVDRRALDPTSTGDTTSTYWFRKLRAGELGGLIVYVTAGSDVATVEYFEEDDGGAVTATRSDDIVYTATGLRPGRYGVRAFVDRDGDARWTPGRIRPYRVGEPITWVADSIEVRSRFDTVLPDTLRIPTTTDDQDAG